MVSRSLLLIGSSRLGWAPASHVGWPGRHHPGQPEQRLAATLPSFVATDDAVQRVLSLMFVSLAVIAASWCCSAPAWWRPGAAANSR